MDVKLNVLIRQRFNNGICFSNLSRIDLAHDVFGRERHRLHKEDMGGVGTFDKECRTLYVGGLGCRTTLEKLLWKEFGEWGEIEVNVTLLCSSGISSSLTCYSVLPNVLQIA